MTDDLAWLFGLAQFGIKLGLSNMRALTQALGEPQRTYKVIHIAGTNGKGSVSAMVEAALRAAGCRTGRYTSPHLRALNERIAIDGEPVSDAALAQSLHAVREAVERRLAQGVLPAHPTFFEVTTAVAFDLFRRHGVEWAVCEVGLGGRLDATNVVDPEVCAITTIEMDHAQHLGQTLSQIAAEKAGIIKPGVPVVLGGIGADARAVILRIASQEAAPVLNATDVQWQPASSAATACVDGPRQLISPRNDYGTVTLALRGDYQRDNARTAVRVLEAVADVEPRVTPDAISTGLRSARWPGRLERLSLPDGRTLLLDAAHNPAGAAALAAYLRQDGPPRPLVFAAMQDKDLAGILRALAPPVTESLWVTRASTARSAEPAQLASIAHSISPQWRVSIAETPAAALDGAWHESRSITAAGSIFLLGDLLTTLHWP